MHPMHLMHPMHRSGLTIGARVRRHSAITALTVDGNTSGTSTSVTTAASSSGLSIASSPFNNEDNWPCCQPGMLDHSGARLVGRHRNAHRVDVRPGHDRDVGDAATKHGADHLRNDGFSRMTER